MYSVGEILKVIDLSLDDNNHGLSGDSLKVLSQDIYGWYTLSIAGYTRHINCSPKWLKKNTIRIERNPFKCVRRLP